MPERVRLMNAGEELVMIVRSVKPETVDKNDYYLVADASKELLVPQSSVVNQLARLNVANVEALIGKGIKFSRSTKMSRANKPFWNVDLATEAEMTGLQKNGVPAAAPANGNPAGATPAPKSYTDLYQKATKFVLDTIVPMYRAAKLEPTAADVHAMTATLFIPKSKEN